MSEISYYAGGGPWGIGDGFIPLNNETITQTMYLSATNSLGVPVTRCKVWFAGNGKDSYLVQSSYLQQGSHTVTVTVNGAATFFIPAYGRWSDYVSTTSFTLPGNVDFISVVKLKVPILIPIIGGGDDTQTGPSAAGVVTVLDQTHSGVLTDAQANSLLVLNFEGANNATTWTEEAQDLPLGQYTVGNPHLDTSIKYSGVSSANVTAAVSGNCAIDYLSPAELTGDFTIRGWWRAENIEAWAAQANGYVSILNLYSSTNSSYVDIWFESGSRWRIHIHDKAGTQLVDSYTNGNPLGFISGHWHHFAVIASGRNISVEYDGVTVASFTASIDTPFAGLDSLYLGGTLSAESISAGVAVHYDAIEVVNYAQPAHFVPVAAPPNTAPAEDTLSVTSTGTITVSDNTLIDAGDTITITEDRGVEVYTFVETPTGAANEILIGSTAALTAANIAEVIGETYGAEFTATSSSNVVTWVKTTDDTVTISDTSDGITVSAVTQTITYTSASASATIPSFFASGTGISHGDLGDIYGLVNIPPLTATGATTMTGINGNVMFPAFTSTGMVYQESVNYNSSDAAKIALLLCGDTWMSDLAAMIAAPGDYDDVALVCTQWVANNITYTSDALDDWNDARHTAMLGSGDCEDGAILLYSLIRNSGVPYTRLRVYIGEWMGTGHAWVMYQRDHDNQWIVLDWTDGAAEWNAISSVQDLDPLYDSIRTIVDSIESEGFGAEEAGFYSDDYPYGEAWEHFNCMDLVTMGTPGEGASEIYADSLYADTNLAVMIAAIPAIRGGLSRINDFGWVDQAVGFGGGSAKLTLPAVKLTSAGKANVIGTLAKAIPRIRLSATGFDNPRGDLAAAIPAIRLSATGVDSPIGSLNKPIPMVKLTASGIAGIIGSLTAPIPSVTLSAAAWWLGGANLSMAIPAVRLNARARAAEIVALALNTKNFGLTKYTNYDYNSLCMFNGKLIGAKRTGIYELEGSDDDGTAIPWKIRTGKVDLKTGKLRYIWLSGTVSGDIKLIVETADGDRYEYDAEPVSETEDEIRVKVGKGLSSKYVIIELQNEADQTITLDKMQIYGMRGER